MAGRSDLIAADHRKRQLEDFFEAALAASGQQEFGSVQKVRLGPVALELSVSPSLQRRGWSTPLAFSPRQDEDPGPCARILVWEGGVFPSPPWGHNYVYTHRGDVRGYQSDRILVAFNYECRLLSLWDRRKKIGIYWTPDGAGLKAYEWAAPMRTLLHWVGLECGLALTHAAAVGLVGKGLLLAGKGGSGKSTTSLACWHAGWQFVADDYCWVTDSPSPRAYAIYNTAKLLPDQSTDLPRWKKEEELSHDKDVFNLVSLGEGALVKSLDLTCVFLPGLRKVDRLAIRPAETRDALAGLSLSTVAQLAGAGPESVKILQRTAASLSCYHLDLCHPVSAVPNLLREALQV